MGARARLREIANESAGNLIKTVWREFQRRGERISDVSFRSVGRRQANLGEQLLESRIAVKAGEIPVNVKIQQAFVMGLDADGQVLGRFARVSQAGRPFAPRNRVKASPVQIAWSVPSVAHRTGPFTRFYTVERLGSALLRRSS
jgi:hypothetical protein